MSTLSATSHSLRLLVCLNCGAPFETAPSGGHHSCTYCRATHELRPRDERPETFAGSGTLAQKPAATEAERFALLREQMGSTHPYDFPPTHLLGLARQATNVARLAEVDSLFRAAEAKVLQGGGFDAEVALFWTAGILRTMYMTKKEFRHARAVDETTLETLTDPVLRSVQRTALANRACDAGNLADAEAWLAPVPRESDVLAVHTHVRLTEARIALMRGDHTRVLERLGREAEQVPLRTDRDAMACLYRAAAYEKLGQLEDAARALDAATRHPGGKLYALGKITDLRDVWPEMALCEQTYPAFKRRAQLRKLGCFAIVLVPVFLVAAGIVGALLAP